MKILQVQFKNRNGHTLRGIVTLPDTEGKVPFVVHLHGFAGSCSGYKSMYTHLSRALAAQGIGSARFDFYGNGESDGEFEDMSFDGLHTDTQDIFAWAAEQPYVDSEKLFLSGQTILFLRRRQEKHKYLHQMPSVDHGSFLPFHIHVLDV